MRALGIAIALSLVACSSSSAPAGSSAPPSDPSPTTPDASSSGAPSGTDAGGSNSPPADGGAPATIDASVASCDASGGCGSLSGLVERTSTAPTHGGKGPVYVAVFEGNPITNASGATMVARALLPSVDLSDADASVAYRIDGIPVSSQAYQVVAFLDDANAVTASNPTPAPGDLVSLDLANGSFSGVPATIASSSEAMSLDLPLNAVIP